MSKRKASPRQHGTLLVILGIGLDVFAPEFVGMVVGLLLLVVGLDLMEEL